MTILSQLLKDFSNNEINLNVKDSEMKLKSKDLKLGKIRSKVTKALSKFEKKEVIKRIWEKDPTVWKKNEKHAESIGNRLGWLSLPYTMTNNVYDINEFTKEVIADGYTTAVLLGMGGSSMGPEVLSNVFGTADGFLKLLVIDTTDPNSIQRVVDSIDLTKTIFIVSSKSGSTIEVDSLFRFFFEKVSAVNPKDAGRQFVAITDKDTKLQELANERGFRKVFTNPSDIGGRYSVLSYFGLVPASLLGIDLIEFLKNAGNMMNMCSNLNSNENPGAIIGIIAGIAALEGKDKLTFLYSDNLSSLGSWVEQLIAESTGKEKTGILPIDGEKAGKAKEYSSDRIFVSTVLGKSDELKRSISSLAKKGYPAISINLANRYDLAGQFYLWEFATAVMGVILGINPFDEPNVKESKDNTAKVLLAFEEKGSLPQEKMLVEDGTISASMHVGAARLKIKSTEKIGVADLLEGFLMLRTKGDYFALLAYIDSDAKNKKMLNKIRELIRKSKRSAVTVGFGPRFLHSTGQFHKGGPDKGMFIQFVNDDKNDLAIPGRNYSFGTLKNAQAIGDYESLIKWKRRVFKVNLGSDVQEGLKKFYGYLKRVV